MKFVALTSTAVPMLTTGAHHSEASSTLHTAIPSPAPRASWSIRRVRTARESRSSARPTSAKASTVVSPMRAMSSLATTAPAPNRCSATSPATQAVSETARTMASPPPRGTGRWWRDLFSGTSMTCALFRSGITTAVKDAETPAVSTRPLRSATVMRPAPGCAVRELAISIGVPTGLPRQ